MERASPQCPYMSIHLNHMKYKNIKSTYMFLQFSIDKTMNKSEMFEEKKITCFGPQLQLWASWTRNPRISSSSSKVTVTFMSNAAGGCNQMSQASGRSGWLILMALSSANLDFVMSTLLQSRPSLRAFVRETMRVEKHVETRKRKPNWQFHGTYFRKTVYETVIVTTSENCVQEKRVRWEHNATL